MDKFQTILKSILNSVGFLNDDEKVSITNLTVMVFVAITAFRALFSGLQLHLGSEINWTVEALDVSSTLPLLFSLLNYGHKRQELNKLEAPVETAASTNTEEKQ